MLTCDYILANSDRHYGNFGLIRNVETLEYIRVAPVYDTGTCLWCRQEQLFSPQDYEYMAKPFGKNGMKRDGQLRLFHEYGWFDENALKGFTNDVLKTLALNQNMSEKRLDAIRRGLDRNIETVIRYVCENR